MNGYFNYILEVNVCLLLLFGGYWLLFRNENNYHFRRLFLIGSIFTAVTLPLISFDISGYRLSTLPQMDVSILLPVLAVGHQPGAEHASHTAIQWPAIAAGIYATGLIAFLLMFVRKLWNLYRFVRSSSPVYSEGRYSIRRSTEDVPALSFFDQIILGSERLFTEEERNMMIRHEMAHARQWHSADIMLTEVVAIFFWFNPVVHILRRHLSDVHEFLADQEVSKDIDTSSYCRLLAKVSLSAAGYDLVNHFHRFLILKRIKMINTMKRKISTWKMAAVLPLFTLLLFLVACHDHVMDDNAMADASALVQNSTQAINAPESIAAALKEMQKAEPNSKFLLLELNDEGHAQMNAMQEKYGLPNFVQVFREGDDITRSVSGEAGEIHIEKNTGIDGSPGGNQRMFAIVRYNPHVQDVLDHSVLNNDVHTIVEETARPAEGMEQFYSHLQSRIKYPIDARTNHVSGKVFVEFVVEEDGTLSNFEVKRGIGNGCDEVAVKALASSPPWIPARHNGKIVKQKMVMPIVFAEDTRSGDILR